VAALFPFEPGERKADLRLNLGGPDHERTHSFSPIAQLPNLPQ
jgi:hypothetical protein